MYAIVIGVKEINVWRYEAKSIKWRCLTGKGECMVLLRQQPAEALMNHVKPNTCLGMTRETLEGISSAIETAMMEESLEIQAKNMGQDLTTFNPML